MHYMRGDFTEPETFNRLEKLLKEQQTPQGGAGNALFYLAVADRFFGPMVDQLGRAGLARQSENAWRRVIIEKPFGHDFASAKALNARIGEVLSEDQIYRIDHFLGKETLQNILVLRFASGIFEPLWNRDHIDHVQITAAETVGVESRGRFYGQTAPCELVPNHLFQLLAMIGLEPPISFAADACAQSWAIHPFVSADAVRGQYGAGTVLGKEVRAYRREPNVAPESAAETYVALKLGIDNWRWAGVPFYLRTGKALSARTTEIAVQFRRAPYSLFRDTPVERLPANILTLRIQRTKGCLLFLSLSAVAPGSRSTASQWTLPTATISRRLRRSGTRRSSTIASSATPRRFSGPIRSRPHGAPCRVCSMPGGKRPATTCTPTPPVVRVRMPPIA
jgi:glucose-6-phosphate 1-dehydrogenase